MKPKPVNPTHKSESFVHSLDVIKERIYGDFYKTIDDCKNESNYRLCGAKEQSELLSIASTFFLCYAKDRLICIPKILHSTNIFSADDLHKLPYHVLLETEELCFLKDKTELSFAKIRETYCST